MILTKDNFIARVNARVGESTTDDDLSFLEDMTDTYNDLESRTHDDRIAELEAENESLRKRYRERFELGTDNTDNYGRGDEIEEDEITDTLTFEGLFKED